MNVATVLLILNVVNGLLGVAVQTPAVLDEARSLLKKVEPYVHECGVGVATYFESLKEQAGV
jgi:hypothetical protein